MSGAIAILHLLAALGVGATAPAERIFDAGRAALACHHPSGRFTAAVVVAAPWPGAAGMGAERSALVRVHWRGGLTGRPYATEFALMARAGRARAVVLGDNSILPPAHDCALRDWTSAGSVALPPPMNGEPPA